jgi:ankyrin repeat protein
MTPGSGGSSSSDTGSSYSSSSSATIAADSSPVLRNYVNPKVPNTHTFDDGGDNSSGSDKGTARSFGPRSAETQTLVTIEASSEKHNKAVQTMASGDPHVPVKCLKCRQEEVSAPREQILADAKMQSDMMMQVAQARRRLKQGVGDYDEVRSVLQSLATASKAGACSHCQTLYLLDEPFCRQCGTKRRDPFVKEYSKRLAAEKNVLAAEEERKAAEANKRALLSAPPVDAYGPAALLVAAERGDEVICLDVLARKDWSFVNRRDNCGNTAVIWAAYHGLSKVCMAILERSDFDSVNACDSQGNTALSWASYQSLSDVCLALLQRKDFTKLTARDEDGNTAFHWAAERGMESVCLALLGRPDFNQTNVQDRVYGRTALHCAAYRGLVKACEKLLARQDFKAVNAVDVAGSTALHFAATRGLDRVCDAILARTDFVHVHLKDGLSGRTAAECAEAKGHTALAGKLSNAFGLRTNTRSPA